MSYKEIFPNIHISHTQNARNKNIVSNNLEHELKNSNITTTLILCKVVTKDP
jgi:hypothetical protein